jgi:hypothetical protein
MLIMKTILVFPAPKALETPKLFFLKAHLTWAFKKTIFIMSIAAYAKNKKESAKRTLFCLTCQERDLNS